MYCSRDIAATIKMLYDSDSDDYEAPLKPRRTCAVRAAVSIAAFVLGFGQHMQCVFARDK